MPLTLSSQAKAKKYTHCASLNHPVRIFKRSSTSKSLQANDSRRRPVSKTLKSLWMINTNEVFHFSTVHERTHGLILVFSYPDLTSVLPNSSCVFCWRMAFFFFLYSPLVSRWLITPAASKKSVFCFHDSSDFLWEGVFFQPKKKQKKQTGDHFVSNKHSSA